MSKAPVFEPTTVLRELECDTNRLLSNLPDAIGYLEEVQAAHPDKRLMLDWDETHLGSFTLAFFYADLETPEEVEKRRQEYQAAEAKRRHDRDIAERRDNIEKELRRLKIKLDRTR